MGNFNLSSSAFGENVEKTPVNNRSQHYYWMENARGRKVPIAPYNVAACLKRGYVHIDRVLQHDDPADRVKTPLTSSDPIARLAATVEKLADVKEEKPKRRRTRKKVEEVEEEKEEEKVEEEVKE